MKSWVIGATIDMYWSEKSKPLYFHSLGDEATALEQSFVSDYETKLSMKREEVAQLLQEREELKATHNRLLTLQKKMHFRQVRCFVCSLAGIACAPAAYVIMQCRLLFTGLPMLSCNCRLLFTVFR